MTTNPAQSEDRHWYRLAVPLAWVRSLDEHSSPAALGDALGDRYLYRFNPFFAGVRDAALKFGYRFSSEKTPLWLDYQGFSLTTLHRIIADRTIPYFDTLSTLGRLLERDPRVALSPGFLLSNLKANHAFHESAHCVAHSVLENFRADLTLLETDEKRRYVVEALFAECFANVVELLGTTCERMPISDVLFYGLNSYTFPLARATEMLNEGGQCLGPLRRFQTLFLAYFESNLTPEPPSEPIFERICLAVKATGEEIGQTQKLIRAAFGLSEGFRQNTTPMYFDLLGHGKEYAALQESAWLGVARHAQVACEVGAVFFRLVPENR